MCRGKWCFIYTPASSPIPGTWCAAELKHRDCREVVALKGKGCSNSLFPGWEGDTLVSVPTVSVFHLKISEWWLSFAWVLDPGWQRGYIRSGWWPVPSGVPQNFILGPVLLTAFKNDLDSGSKCILYKFTDDIKLGRAVDPLGGWRGLAARSWQGGGLGNCQLHEAQWGKVEGGPWWPAACLCCCLGLRWQDRRSSPRLLVSRLSSSRPGSEGKVLVASNRAGWDVSHGTAVNVELEGIAFRTAFQSATAL